jgi:predicted MFS family arabinose efflux permease
MFQRALNIYVQSFSGLSRDIWLLSAVMLINRAGTMVIPFMTVYLTQNLGFTLAQAGLVMTCFGAGSVLGAYLGGNLSDRFGYYRVQVGALIGSGILFVVLSYFQSLLALCILIFLISTVADAFRPANFVAVAAYSRPGNRTRALALIRLAVNLGFAVGPAVGGLVAARIGYGWLFWIDGLTCIFAGLFLMAALKPKATKTEASTQAAAAPVRVFKDRRYMFFLLLVLANALVFMQLFNSLPVFLKQDYGLGEDQIGRLMAMNGLLIALVEMPLIYLVERRFNLYRVVGFGTLLIGLSFLVYNFFTPWIFIAWVSMIIITVGEMLSLPFVAAMAIEFSNEQNRGQYMSMFSMSWAVSQIIAPTMGLQIAGAWGFSTLWTVLMAFSLTALVGFYYLGARVRAEQAAAI